MHSLPTQASFTRFGVEYHTSHFYNYYVRFVNCFLRISKSFFTARFNGQNTLNSILAEAWTAYSRRQEGEGKKMGHLDKGGTATYWLSDANACRPLYGSERSNCFVAIRASVSVCVTNDSITQSETTHTKTIQRVKHTI